MSKNLNSSVSQNSAKVRITSFAGGENRGRCLQVAQNWEDVVHMDRTQVEQTVATMQQWLKDTF
mgnify:CR=1 FL=1